MLRASCRAYCLSLLRFSLVGGGCDSNLEEITLFQASVVEKQYWQSQTINILKQTEAQSLEILETIQMVGAKLIVFMEGRKPRCFTYVKSGYLRAEHSRLREDFEEKEEEEKETGIRCRETESSNEGVRQNSGKRKTYLSFLLKAAGKKTKKVSTRKTI